MKSEDATIIQLDQLTKTYGSGHTAVQALQEITLSVPTGAFWSIMGPSGSGKSSLLHILGLLDRPTSGKLTVGGESVTAHTDISKLAELRQRFIGFIFQQFFLLPRLSAQENVMLPALYAGQSTKAARARAMRLLEQVGVAERAEHRPNQLSGGEQQRVAIARALTNDPAILLADEPTGNLDSKNGIAILELIESLNQEGKTVIMVTHDATIGKRAQKIVHLKDGKLEQND